MRLPQISRQWGTSRRCTPEDVALATASSAPSRYIHGIVSAVVLGFTCTSYWLGDISAIPSYPVKGTG